MPDEQGAYASAGVDIDRAQRALDSVREAVRATHGKAVLGGIGGFGAMFEADFAGVERPVLVSSVDGVGTKTKVAAMAGDWSGIGHDIVNHCVNDVLCQGARPLFFLDYFGCSRLDPDAFTAVVAGAAAACASVGCSLIGGETAEMPGVYHEGEADVVGCIVGIVDYAQRLPRTTVAAGDVLIGLASDGLHTNGFSLARRALFDQGGLSASSLIPGTRQTFTEALLRPHRCYFSAIEGLLGNQELEALAHITGGGLCDNVPRVLPEGVGAVIERDAWDPPQLFGEIQSHGGVPEAEMYRAFNMGVGMVAIVSPDSVERIVRHLVESGERAFPIGRLEPGGRTARIV